MARNAGPGLTRIPEAAARNPSPPRPTTAEPARPSRRRTCHRVIVTGGAGFIGSHLCERLLERGNEIICLDNFTTATPANVAHLLRNEHFHLINGDITQPQHLPGALDLVLHFASPASPTDYLRRPIETLKTGSLGTMHALELAQDKHARFILASTSQVYGDPQQHPQHETYPGNVNPVGPRAAYDEAKRFAEALTAAYRTTHGLHTGIARLFNIYGPRMRPDDGRAIPTFTRQALAGEPITVAGDGSQTRSPCYIDDAIEGIIALAESDYCEPVNIGNPEETTILDLALRIKSITNSNSPIQFVARPADDPQVRKPDISRAKEKLQWSPRIRTEQGLRNTVQYLQYVISQTAILIARRPRRPNRHPLALRSQLAPS